MGMLGQFLLDFRNEAYQQDSNTQLPRRLHGALNLRTRRMVSTHRIYGYGDHSNSGRERRKGVKAYRVRPRCPQLPGLCNSRTAGKPGEAASFRDSWGTWRGPELSKNHERAACSSARGSDVVLDWACKLLRLAPESLRHHKLFLLDILLLFEPVLLQTRQGRRTGIGCMAFTAAFLVIQIHSALRAQATAIAAADGLHRQGQENLFGQHVGQK